MHVELILEPQAPAFDDDDSAVVEPFRRTTWEIWDRGRLVAIAGHSWRNRSDALAAMLRLLGGSLEWSADDPSVPAGVNRHDGRIPIVLVR